MSYTLSIKEMLSVKGLAAEFCRKHTGLLIVYMILLLVFPLKMVVIPYLAGQIIELIKDDPADFYTTAKWTRAWKRLLGSYAVSVVMQGLLEIVDVYISSELYTFMRNKMFQAIFKCYRRDFTNPTVSNIVYKAAVFPEVMMKLLYVMRIILVPGAFILLGLASYTLWLHWSVGILFVATLAITVALWYGMVRVCGKRSTEAYEENDQLMERLGDVLDNLLAVYSASCTKREYRKLAKKQADCETSFRRVMFCHFKFTFPFQVVVSGYFIGAVMLLTVLSRKRSNGGGTLMNTKTLIPSAMILLESQELLNQLGNLIMPTIFEISQLYKMQAFFDKLPKVPDIEPRGPPPPPSQTMISVDNATTQNKAIRDVRLQIRKGDIVVLTGPVGSGKSTLLRTIVGMHPMAQGDILIGGESIKTLDTDDIDDKVTYVAQLPTLLDRSVQQNIELGREKNDDEKPDPDEVAGAQALLAAVGIPDVEATRPAGKGGVYLSGGQRQLVTLARSLLHQKPVMMYDEPTASVSPKLRPKSLRVLLQTLAADRDRIVVIATHTPEDVIEACARDQTLIRRIRNVEMKDGTVVTRRAPP